MGNVSRGSLLSVLLAFGLLAGCVEPPPLAMPDVEALYKPVQPPPAGLARVYILPPLMTMLFVPPSEQGFASVTARYKPGQPEKIGNLDREHFVAFDAKPGMLTLYAQIRNGTTVFTAYEDVNLAENETRILRPIADLSHSASIFGIVAALADQKMPGFEKITPANANESMKGKRLSLISPAAAAFLQQGDRAGDGSSGTNPDHRK